MKCSPGCQCGVSTASQSLSASARTGCCHNVHFLQMQKRGRAKSLSGDEDGILIGDQHLLGTGWSLGMGVDRRRREGPGTTESLGVHWHWARPEVWPATNPEP